MNHYSFSTTIPVITVTDKYTPATPFCGQSHAFLQLHVNKPCSPLSRADVPVLKQPCYPLLSVQKSEATTKIHDCILTVSKPNCNLPQVRSEIKLNLIKCCLNQNYFYGYHETLYTMVLKLWSLLNQVSRFPGNSPRGCASPAYPHPSPRGCASHFSSAPPLPQRLCLSCLSTFLPQRLCLTFLPSPHPCPRGCASHLPRVPAWVWSAGRTLKDQPEERAGGLSLARKQRAPPPPQRSPGPPQRLTHRPRKQEDAAAGRPRPASGFYSGTTIERMSKRGQCECQAAEIGEARARIQWRV